MPTHFSDVGIFFPEPGANSEIDTKQFINAGHGIVAFCGFLGTGFSPVKNDIGGNVEKVAAKFATDEAANGTLQKLVDLEIAVHKGKPLGALQGLLWLKRGLEFICWMYDMMIKEYNAGNRSEDLSPILKSAYENTLKRHHNWVSKKLFSVVLMAAPYRSHLIKTIARGDEYTEDGVMADMEKYLVTMKQNVEILVALFIEKGLDTPPE